MRRGPLRSGQAVRERCCSSGGGGLLPSAAGVGDAGLRAAQPGSRLGRAERRSGSPRPPCGRRRRSGRGGSAATRFVSATASPRQPDGRLQTVHVECAQHGPVPARSGPITHRSHSRIERLGRLKLDQRPALVRPLRRGTRRPVRDSVEAVRVGWAKGRGHSERLSSRCPPRRAPTLVETLAGSRSQAPGPLPVSRRTLAGANGRTDHAGPRRVVLVRPRLRTLAGGPLPVLPGGRSAAMPGIGRFRRRSCPTPRNGRRKKVGARDVTAPSKLATTTDMTTVIAAGPASGSCQLVKLADPGGAIAVVQMPAGGRTAGLRTHERHNLVTVGPGSRG